MRLNYGIIIFIPGAIRPRLLRMEEDESCHPPPKAAWLVRFIRNFKTHTRTRRCLRAHVLSRWYHAWWRIIYFLSFVERRSAAGALRRILTDVYVSTRTPFTFWRFRRLKALFCWLTRGEKISIKSSTEVKAATGRQLHLHNNRLTGGSVGEVMIKKRP